MSGLCFYEGQKSLNAGLILRLQGKPPRYIFVHFTTMCRWGAVFVHEVVGKPIFGEVELSGSFRVSTCTSYPFRPKGKSMLPGKSTVSESACPANILTLNNWRYDSLCTLSFTVLWNQDLNIKKPFQCDFFTAPYYQIAKWLYLWYKINIFQMLAGTA